MQFLFNSQICLIALAGLMLTAAPLGEARAAQQLIATPYPEMLGGSANLGGGAPVRHYHQHLIDDPVPQSLGPTALGNPHSIGNHHGRQRLLPTPYWREIHHFH